MIPTLLLLLAGCGDPTPAPPAPAAREPRMNFPPPPPPADPLPVVRTWDDLAALDNRWAEVQGALIQVEGGKSARRIPYTYLQLDDGTLVSIGAAMPEAWSSMLRTKVALTGIVTRCLNREVSQWFTGPFIDDWDTPRVIDPAPTLLSEEVLVAQSNRVFEDCRGG